MAGVKKRILLTGARGFIGRNVVEQLGEKYSLLAPHRSELDLLSTEQVDAYSRGHRIDVVIHAAVVGGSRKEEQTDSALAQNMRMFFNIARQKRRFKWMIFLGSGAEYDKSRPLVKVKEKDFGNYIPQDEYALAKYLCSKYIELSKDIVSLRIFGLFGKYEDYRYRFISNAICRNLSGKPITMNQNVFFDYVYIDDFIKILDHFIEHKPTRKFFNIGTGKMVDLATLAHEINSFAKKKSKIIIKNPGLNNEYSCDNSMLKKEIPKFRFKTRKLAIKELYDWYRMHEDEIVI